MRINVIGTRGFPRIQGGVEKHCECLYPLLAGRGCEIKVFRRKPYVNNRNKSARFKGIIFSDLWCPKNKNFEAISHSLYSALLSLLDRPDIVHIHNIGPSLVLPILRLGRIKTVVTYHSANYEHDKWGKFAKLVLRLAERLTFGLADQLIFVSKAVYESENCRQKSYIPNGVHTVKPSRSVGFLQDLGVRPDNYILFVGRYTPEKGLLDLLGAYKELSTDCNLVIAGDADHETSHSKAIRQEAAKDRRVILAGFISGEALRQVYSHARLFVFPSHNEGFPIALLEAMSYGLPVLVSDIPANKQVNLPEERYFQRGNVSDLKAKIENLIQKPLTEEQKREMRQQIGKEYNWKKIADQTKKVYEKALNG